MSRSTNSRPPNGPATIGGQRRRLILAGVAATSAAGIVFEIALTRVFAIAQFYHFAYLAVSLALLGFGASGSALYVFPRLGSGGPRSWAGLAAGQSAATIGAYGLANWLPFDSFAIAWDRVQVFYLVVYYLALAIPFFFGGLVIAVLLAGSGLDHPIPSHRVYAASLGGSGAGAALALGGLDLLGGEATIALAATVAMIGALSFAAGSTGLRRLRWGAATAAIGLLLLGLVVPAPLQLNLSPYKDLSAALRYPGAEVTASAWDRGTRIDLVSSEGIRSVPGLSFTHSGIPPRQDGVTFDGDDLSAVPRFDINDADFTSHVLSAVSYQLRPQARTLVLQPRGGLDLTIALGEGAASVVAVEPSASAVQLIKSNGPSVYADRRVKLIDQDPRAFVGGGDELFDIVNLPLTAPYRPVTSGAYSLSENYLLTVEAFDSYLDRLAPGGLLTATRWIQTPPSEETRLLATAVEALRNRGNDPADTVIVLRSYSNSVLIVAPDGVTERDLAVVDEFVRTESFDIVFAPDRAATNLFNVLPTDHYAQLAASVVEASDLDAVYRAHDFEIAAPSDDRPFFGHFFKWSQASTVLDTLGRTWQPFGGAGYFVLIALLGIAGVAALTLITAPLLIRRTRRIRAAMAVRWWTLGYFGLLGIAFMFVEIPLIQQYILLVGRPATAFTVVLASILIGSGVGSAWSPRIPWLPAGVLLTLIVLAYPTAIGAVAPLALPAPSAARMLITAAMVLPLGVLMGIMFPRGLTYIERHDPQLVPWAWAVNGTMSVISAILAGVLALSFGFSLVLQAGAAAYGLTVLMAGRRPLSRPPG